MAFNIVIYTNKSPKNQVRKSITRKWNVSGELKEGTSMINPIIKFNGNVSSFVDCNYIYISEFGRYYFVTNMTSITARIVEFTCHVDVLMSFSEYILKNEAIVKRQENDWNLYLNDGSFKIYQNPIVLTKAFPSGFRKQEFVLAVSGS